MLLSFFTTVKVSMPALPSVKLILEIRIDSLVFFMLHAEKTIATEAQKGSSERIGLGKPRKFLCDKMYCHKAAKPRRKNKMNFFTV